MLSPPPITAKISVAIRCCWFISLLLGICGSVPAAAWAQINSVPSVHVDNPSPIVSFDVYEPGPDGAIPQHARTPSITYSVDAQGVPQAQVGAVIARHIATISGAASGMDNPDLDIAKAVAKRKSVSNSEQAALDWLMRNFVEIADNAIVWHYTFNHTFNNIVIKSGWPSAFSQADVIKAFLVAYGRTADARYIELAKRAAYAYTVTCEKGGLRCVVGGVPWFEEVPVPYGYAPMILNGHLYSVVMLRKLLDVAYDDRIAEAFRVGVDSAKRMLLQYDTGYWSIYQQRPRLLDVVLALYPEAENTEIHSVSVSSPSSQTSVLQLGDGQASTYPGNRVWGPGWSGGDTWGRILTGLAKITILPGRLSIPNDPVHVGTLTVSVKYKSPGCIPPTLATYDYRARSQGVVSIAPRGTVIAEDSCPILTYSLPTSLNQWSQLTEFYHDWHTRLVTELWRITKDAKFYTTAVRWGRYAVAESKLAAETTKGMIAEPIFSPSESPEDDATIAAVLEGRDPVTLSDDEIASALYRWIELKCLPPRHALALLARAGLMADSTMLPSCSKGARARTIQEDQINARLSGAPQAIANAVRPIAVVALDKNLFLTTNYSHLSLIDTDKLSVTDPEIEWKISKGKFSPTGLAFSEKTRTLFIANQLGNNILVADFDLEKHKIIIHQELENGIIMSPEGVAYDDKKKIIVTAQHNGDSVAVFETSDTGWRVRCTATVPEPYGVAIGESYVFATSLAARQLLKIDPNNCGIIDRIGELGWDARAGQFMWPTTVQHLSNGMIGVSDAHTGRVYIIDPETLSVQAWFGGNGPGVGALNMPYGFSERAGKVLVASTYGNRLIEFDITGKFQRSYSLDAIWPTRYHPDRSRMIDFPGWKLYLGQAAKVDMFEKCLRAGYGKLHTCNEKRTFNLPNPGDTPLSGGSYFYFTQIASVPDGALVLSPQNPIALYIAALPSAIALLPSRIGFDSWLDGDKIVRPGSNLAINQLISHLSARARHLADDMARSGGLPISEIVKYLRESEKSADSDPTAREAPAEDVAAIMKHFRDPAGMEFVTASEHCAKEGCTEMRRCEISAPMADSLKSESTIDLVRFAIASQMNDCLLRSFLAQEE
jgi:DNA-binding beta-propeller fold protein YncE